jgi:hypothetical protein
MLILDKQKAVEHLVALTAGDAVTTHPEERLGRLRARTYQRVARYERKPAAAGGLPPRRSPFRFRRRLVPIEGAPV